MLFFLIAFSASLIGTLLVIRYSHLHCHFSADHDTGGVQKFHSHPVPRIGGFAIIVSIVVTAFYMTLHKTGDARTTWLLLVAASPAFIGGFVEDVTKKVSVSTRLGLTMLAAVLGFFLLDAGLKRLDIAILDPLFAYWPISLIVTAFCVGGVANAINIIDGFNGLAAMVSVIILAGLAYVSFIVGDTNLAMIALTTAGAVLGFFVWNWPRGLIFLGDGGAYFVGFMIGEISLLLLAKHPEVSTWFPLLLVFYPVFETIFSIYRRKVLRGTSPGLPDAAHLHSLIFKRVVKWAVGSKEAHHMVKRNSMTSPYLWLLCSVSTVPAVLFWDNTAVLIAGTAVFAATYLYYYRQIVKFGRSKRKPLVLKDRTVA
jgi:UDP-GlcNAc:undecaprenyl-phosphate/decaprenyl-phosphate GlcNAc-1-phosphate transferase